VSDISTSSTETNLYIQAWGGFRIASIQSGEVPFPTWLRAGCWHSFTSEDAEDTETRTLTKIGFTAVSSVSSVVVT
jgi:hypothetical protein